MPVLCRVFCKSWFFWFRADVNQWKQALINHHVWNFEIMFEILWNSSSTRADTSCGLRMPAADKILLCAEVYATKENIGRTAIYIRGVSTLCISWIGSQGSHSDLFCDFVWGSCLLLTVPWVVNFWDLLCFYRTWHLLLQTSTLGDRIQLVWRCCEYPSRTLTHLLCGRKNCRLPIRQIACAGTRLWLANRQTV